MRINEVDENSEYSELARIVLKTAEKPPISVDSLTFTDFVYLGAVLRAGIGNNSSFIIPYYTWGQPLTYCYETDIGILKYLHSKNILTVSVNSDITSIVNIDAENANFIYYVNQVIYDINICTNKNETKNEFIQRLLEPTFIKTTDSQVIELWKQIAYTECIQLLDFQMSKYNLPYKVGTDTEAFFKSILSDFSLATIYSFIYQSAKSAAAYYQENHVSKHQAANSILSRMRTTAGRVKDGSYATWEYTRPKECPQLILSEYFFNSILNLLDRYWLMTPQNPFF
ncbi:hypothetical protein [Treponema putidum]|uniref:hypothetical protein n=1 Tax=Treponema putidum TaxID=221027 RepID=UPI003D8F5B80